MPPHIIVCPKPIYEDFQAIYAIKTAAGILSAALFCINHPIHYISFSII